jgi:chemotaxis response regulator CheB
MPLRVLVVDDSAYMRKTLKEMLSRSGEIEVVGVAATARMRSSRSWSWIPTW